MNEQADKQAQPQSSSHVPADRDSKFSKAASFGGAAVALGVAAVVARVACPGGCPACTTCAQSVVPAAASALAVGAAITSSYAVKKRSRRKHHES